MPPMTRTYQNTHTNYDIHVQHPPFNKLAKYQSHPLGGSSTSPAPPRVSHPNTKGFTDEELHRMRSAGHLIQVPSNSATLIKNRGYEASTAAARQQHQPRTELASCDSRSPSLTAIQPCLVHNDSRSTSSHQAIHHVCHSPHSCNANGHAEPPPRAMSKTPQQTSVNGSEVPCSPVDAKLSPQAVQLASKALSTGQGLFENAWRVTCAHVQAEIAKLQEHFAKENQAEKARTTEVIRRAHSEADALHAQFKSEREKLIYEKTSLFQENQNLRKKIIEDEGKGLERRIFELTRDNGKLAAESTRLAMENAKLRQGANRKQVQCASTQERSHSTVRPGSPTTSTNNTYQSPEHVDAEMRIATSADVREERARRIEAERKLEEVQKHLQAIANATAAVSFLAPPTNRSAVASPGSERTLRSRRSNHKSSHSNPVEVKSDRSVDSTLKPPRVAHAKKRSRSGSTVVDPESSGRALVPPTPERARLSESLTSYGIDEDDSSMEISVPTTPTTVPRKDASLPDTPMSASSDHDRSRKRAHTEPEDGEVRESQGEVPPRGQSEANSTRSPSRTGEKSLSTRDERSDAGQGLYKPNPTLGEKRTTRNECVLGSKRRKLGIHHMDMLFERNPDQLRCRMCIRDRKTNNATGQVATFALDSSWAVLIGHCETDHHDACEELEKLSPSQVVERLQRGKHLS